MKQLGVNPEQIVNVENMQKKMQNTVVLQK